MKVGSPKTSTDSGSWRQAIFKKVTASDEQHPKKRSKEELRALWKKSYRQALLLVRMEKENIRMEKENVRLKAHQEETAVKRIKLEYNEIKTNSMDQLDVLEMITNDSQVKCDKKILARALRQGIPKNKRGEVWHFLAEEFSEKLAPVDVHHFPNYNIGYDNLLKQLTSHQHAILIDLGRTFPNHPYFSSPLGPGQLALFNLLKAYSLLDPEVGYCQGLSFVAGVLLLHVSAPSLLMTDLLNIAI